MDTKFLLVFALFVLLVSSLQAQNDTLVIKLKNGQSEKIAISQISKTQFENVTGVDEKHIKTTDLQLNNYPNPFSENTSIEFEIASYGDVVVLIYDNNGEQIQKLECNNCPTGKNTLQWNCLDKNNKRVSTGMYYYEVRFNNEIQSKQMILVK